jgi:hypothetical protein
MTDKSDFETAADAIVAGLYRRFKDWSKRGFGPDDVTWCEVKADVINLLMIRDKLIIEAVGKLRSDNPPFDLYANGWNDACQLIVHNLAELGKEDPACAEITERLSALKPNGGGEST